MKKSLTKSLATILRILARATVKKYAPEIIGVTGSVGKTSTKLAIWSVLRGYKSVRVAPGNLNNELGLPLAILGDSQEPTGFFFWIQVILVSVWRLMVRHPYPALLILEYAADHPGDIHYLTNIARPRVGVITAVGDVPVHVEFYPDPESVAREKAKLIEVLPSSGFAIVNYDDPQVMAFAERTRAKKITFGFKEGAEVRVSNFEERLHGDMPAGISFKLEYGGSFVPVRMDHSFGKASAYAAAAAAAVGIAYGLHLVRISESLAFYEPPKHRMRVVQGKNGVLVVDDTYNASPLSMREAIHTLQRLPLRRKVAVLGDMRELGKYAVSQHEAIGTLAGEVFEVIVAVGEYATVVGEAARAVKVRGKGKQEKRQIILVKNVEEAIQKVPSLLHPGDAVLVKGSRSVGLEKLVETLIR